MYVAGAYRELYQLAPHIERAVKFTPHLCASLSVAREGGRGGGRGGGGQGGIQDLLSHTMQPVREVCLVLIDPADCALKGLSVSQLICVTVSCIADVSYKTKTKKVGGGGGGGGTTTKKGGGEKKRRGG